MMRLFFPALLIVMLLSILPGWTKLALVLVPFLWKALSSVRCACQRKQRFCADWATTWQWRWMVFGVALGARLLMMACIQVPLQSDYATYFQRAALLAAGSTNPWDVYTLVIAPNIWSFVATLALVFRVTGVQIWVAQAFVALCYAGAMAAVFEVARRMLSLTGAAACALLLAVMPETLLYTLNIGNESLALLLLFSGLLCCLKARETAWQWALLGGALLAACDAVRPIGMLVLGTLLFCWIGKDRAARRALWATLLGYAVCALLLRVCRAQVLQAQTYESLGWTLYEGLDLTTAGQWSAEKSETLRQLLATLPPEQVQPTLLQLTLERVRLYTVWQWMGLMARKCTSLWADCGYVLLGNTAVAAKAVSAMMLWCGLLWFSMEEQPWLLVLPLVLLTLFAAFGTSISRYHFVVLPFVWMGAMRSLSPNARIQQTGLLPA